MKPQTAIVGGVNPVADRPVVITFIDTPGVWAEVEAEELGQGEAIACQA